MLTSNSVAYGVNAGPTIVFIDALGLVREIRYGRLGGDSVDAAFQQTILASAE